MAKDIKILIADDEADFRQVMTVWLESKGYSVITAANGKEALKLLKDEKPNIVFLDLRMPFMDGSETIKKIREFDKNIPVIVISSYVSDLQLREVSKAGISGVFNKYADFDSGLALLESVLRRHKKLKK